MASAGEPTSGTEVGEITLWGFYVSSCTWRVRLALGLKGIPFAYKALNISKGEHKSEEFKKLSPLTYVPAVEVDGVAIADSMAIVMYFEEKFPDKRPLLPVDLVKRAHVRQIMYLIGANIQPLQNLGTLQKIEKISDAETRLKWAQDHINEGFTALEQLLKSVAGKYCVGDELTLADVFLVPQIGNANRFKVDVTQYPTIDRIGKALLELPEVQASLPANQPDAPK
jgi:maleylacetoacetate isomerase